MTRKRIHVGVNGYGVIGKRVADAIALQDDMSVAGVADIAADWRIRVANERGFAVYASSGDAAVAMRAAGLSVTGSLDDLAKSVDVMVDCTPKKVAAHNRELYEASRVKRIWQGGEKHDLAGYSFVAQVNYGGAIGRDSARVVSCNTTALARVTHALHGRGLVKRVRAVLLRRATDPWESHVSGMINTVVPEMRVPSHQGPDLQSVIPEIDITTLAAAGPFNLSHLHFAMIETTRPVTVDEVKSALLGAPRIAFVRASDGVVALNSTIEMMRDMGRMRGDMWEVAVWEDAIAADGHDVYLTYQVHNEAIVIPETIDCIRALTGIETEGKRSIAKTDAALGIRKNFVPLLP